MTSWVLVVMMCGRFCYPQYAIVYPSQEECAKQVPPPRIMDQTTKYCVPLIKVKE